MGWSWSDIRDVLGRYDLDIAESEQLAEHHFLLTTPHGRFSLLFEPALSRAHTVHRVTEHLARQGVRRVGRFVRTLYGEPWVESGTGCFVVRLETEGSPALVQTDDLIDSAAYLARIHSGLDDFNGAELQCAHRHGTWRAQFAHGEQRLHHWTEGIRLQHRSTPFTETMLQFGPWLTERARQTGVTLERAHYASYGEEQAQLGRICHGDFRREQLVRTPSGQIAVHDWRHVVKDAPLYDLARLCHTVALEDASCALKAFEAYVARRPLSEQEIRILCAYLFFPHSGLRIASYGMGLTGTAANDAADHLRVAVERQQAAEHLLMKNPIIQQVWG